MNNEFQAKESTKESTKDSTKESTKETLVKDSLPMIPPPIMIPENTNPSTVTPYSSLKACNQQPIINTW